jgi:hypothetical protein
MRLKEEKGLAWEMIMIQTYKSRGPNSSMFFLYFIACMSFLRCVSIYASCSCGPFICKCWKTCIAFAHRATYLDRYAKS